jgi:hypothetical protein
MKLILENVRSLAGKHTLDLAPLTILVGENSSGKTTCLGMLSAMFSSLGFPSRPAFNEPPFDFGSFDTIATYKGGKYGRAKRFSLGYSLADENGSEVEMIASYQNSLGQPALHSVSVKRGNGSLSLSFVGDNVTGRVALPRDSSGPAVEQQLNVSPIQKRLLTTNTLRFLLFEGLAESERNPRVMHRMFEFFNIPTLQTIAVAPVRTKPKRTYDQISDEFKPEGDHIPVVLAWISTEA